MHSSFSTRAKTGGFTLLELLVVISIIGILASVVVMAMGPAREKGAIAKEQSQLQEIAKAMEIYRITYNHFPPVSGDICSLCAYRASPGTWTPDRWEDAMDALVPDYISRPIYRDYWGNYYAYDNNYQRPAWKTTFNMSTGVPSILCSLGPNEVLDTWLAGNTAPPSEAGGDDICIFFPDND